jgi:hypothetical protein
MVRALQRAPGMTARRFDGAPVLAAWVAGLAVLLGGCVRVRPHERERLAHPAMAGSVWPSIDRADQHVFSVREGSEGATVEGGGGCGCN